MPKAVFEEEWRPVKDFEQSEFEWHVSDTGRVQSKAYKFYLTPYVRSGDVYVKLVDADDKYVEASLAAILLTSFPESGN